MNDKLTFTIKGVPPYEGVQAWITAAAFKGEQLLSERIELVVQPRPRLLPQWVWDRIIARVLLIQRKQIRD